MHVVSESVALPTNVMSLTAYRERKRLAERISMGTFPVHAAAPPPQPEDSEDDEIPNEPKEH